MVTGRGLGPVFAYDWLTTSRRWQVYAVRSLFVAALLFNLAAVWWSEVRGRLFPSIQAQAEVGRSIYLAIAGTELALVLLAAPAGAICLDKARGTLAHLLVTDLSDVETVLGKLAARLVPILGLVACALPVKALGGLLGGIDPQALLGAFLVRLGCAVLGSTVAFALSVWAGKTHEVLLATYALGLLWLLAYPIWQGVNALWVGGPPPGPPPGMFLASNPFWLAFAPVVPGGTADLGEPARFLLGALLLSVALAALATARVRPVVTRQAGRPGRAGRAGGRPGRRSTATRCCGASGTGGDPRAGSAPSGCSTAS